LAIQAHEAMGVAVILHDVLAACGLVQVVHVLGDDPQEHVPFFQIRQGVVGRVGPGPDQDPVHFLEHDPDLGGVFLKGPDGGVFRRVEALPQTPGAPEIGDARLHRNAGPGDSHGFAALFEESGQLRGGDGFHGKP
jgi:hypothetical protein